MRYTTMSAVSQYLGTASVARRRFSRGIRDVFVAEPTDPLKAKDVIPLVTNMPGNQFCSCYEQHKQRDSDKHVVESTLRVGGVHPNTSKRRREGEGNRHQAQQMAGDQPKGSSIRVNAQSTLDQERYKKCGENLGNKSGSVLVDVHATCYPDELARTDAVGDPIGGRTIKTRLLDHALLRRYPCATGTPSIGNRAII